MCFCLTISKDFFMSEFFMSSAKIKVYRQGRSDFPFLFWKRNIFCGPVLVFAYNFGYRR